MSVTTRVSEPQDAAALARIFYHAGHGVGRATLASLQAEMREHGAALLTTEASLAARVFLRQGWRDLAQQTVVKNGVHLSKWCMNKRLY